MNRLSMPQKKEPRMDLRQLTPDISVSPQILPQDVAALADAGFRVLINNRPDEEAEPGQDSETIARLAREAGLEYHYIPFHPGQITPDMVTAFGAAMDSAGPKMAYCRSGNRSTVLWALSQAGRIPEAELVEIATRAGYDLTPVRGLIRSLGS